MAVAQSVYGTAPAIGLPGQLANEELKNIISRVVGETHPGSVILLHDIKQQTADALPAILNKRYELRPLLPGQRLDAGAQVDGALAERVDAEPLQVADDGGAMFRVLLQLLEGVEHGPFRLVDARVIGDADIGDDELVSRLSL